jgi:hypothetical protein
MKKHMLIALIIICSLAPGGYPQERADVVESITPSSAMLFLKTSRIKNFVVSVKFVADNLLHKEYAEKFNKKINEIKTKTGVDPMDIESLKKAGIDVDRTASLAMYPEGKKKEERILLFIPVLDEKTFPLKFVEILKKMAGTEKVDLYPAITEYKNYTIYQINKDIFTTAIDGVFIVGSTGELVRSVIDVKVDNIAYLAIDPMYVDYQSRLKKSYDLRAFVTKDFLKDAVKSRARPDGNKKKEEKKETVPITQNHKDVSFGTHSKEMLVEAAYIADAAGGGPSARSEMDKLSTGSSPFNAVDYAFLGAMVSPADIDVDLAARFNNTSGTVNTFLDVIKTGASGRALHVKNANTYAYVSFDYNKIEELCRASAAGCSYYTQFKDEIKSDLGIDFDRDIIPSYSGVLNIIAGQPKGAGGGYLFYLPMNDTAQGKKVWEKSSGFLREKYKGTERYGTAKIGGMESFWYIDSKNNKNYMLADKRGIYLGNDPELIGMALSSREISKPEAADGVINKLGGNVFFLTYMKKDSFFGALLMLYAYRNREISGVVEKMTDLYLIGEKSGNMLSFGLKIKLMKRK